MDDDSHLDPIVEHQKKIIGDFRTLYFDIKNITNGLPENSVSELKTGRNFIDAIDRIEREQLSLAKEEDSIASKLLTIDNKHSSLCGSFFPCFIAREKTRLNIRTNNIALEKKKLQQQLSSNYNSLEALLDPIRIALFNLEHPPASRFNTPNPSRHNSLTNI